MQAAERTLSFMNAVDAIDETRSTKPTNDGAAARPVLGPPVGSLAFHAGHMGAGLGWHGWTAPSIPQAPITFGSVCLIRSDGSFEADSSVE